tara:strand:+ start:942 stop:1340 length:399 start_codon:yes stop_codon:yes gene_type:complete
MIEDDFFATIKFKSGEEIFCKVASSDEEDRLMLLVSNPVIIAEIKGRTGVVGYKVEPWLKTTKDDMFVINIDDVLTMSESNDMEMISMHQQYIKHNDKNGDGSSKYKLNRKLGYLSTIQDAKDTLEKLYRTK